MYLHFKRFLKNFSVTGGAINAISTRLDHVDMLWEDVMPNFHPSGVNYLYAENGMVHCYATLCGSTHFLTTTAGDGSQIGTHAFTDNRANYSYPRCAVYCDDNTGRSLIGLDFDPYGKIKTYVIGDVSHATRTGLSNIVSLKLDVPVESLSPTVRAKYNI